MLHKSQSSVTSAIHKLQATLRLRAFAVQGRNAVLTPTGQMLYQRARALLDGTAQLGIAPVVPPSMSGEPLMPVRFVPVASPRHPLHRLGRELALRDLRKHRHLVVRDTGARRDKSQTSVDVAQRWTVTHMATSIGAATRGLGFAWFPEDKIRQELENGELKVLPLRGNHTRHADLHLVIPDVDAVGPGTRRLAAIIREEVARDCRERGGATGR